MTKDQILHEALSLDPRDRDEVAEALWQSTSADELTAAQGAEIRRRIDAIDSGEALTITGDEVIAELRQRFAQ